MRSFLFAFVFLFAASSALALVGGGEPDFKIDKQQSKDKLEQLSQLEALLNENPGMTANELVAKLETGDAQLAGISPELVHKLAVTSPQSDYYDPWFDLPAFFFSGAITCTTWAICLGWLMGPVSVIFVFVDSGNDGLAMVEAAAGCLAGNAIAALLYVALVAAGGGF